MANARFAFAALLGATVLAVGACAGGTAGPFHLRLAETHRFSSGAVHLGYVRDA